MKLLKPSFVLVLLALAVSSCSISDKAIRKTGAEGVKETGKIVFTEDFFDFGEITEGDIVKHTFPFKNDGPGPVRLVKTRTSCGCTTAEAALREYAPGENGRLEVEVDTAGKHGMMIKTVEVYLENADKEMIELTLIAQLVPPPHPKVENVLKINVNPKCKSCHLDSGVGHKGGFLYHRVCAQCHGRRGGGASARAMNDKEWLEKVDDEYIRKITAEGLLEKGMPPYVKGVSPALTGEQMDSLIGYIRSWEK